MNAQQRLDSLGISLPTPPAAAGNYLPVVMNDGWIFVSGQLPVSEGRITCTGKVGEDVTLEDAYQAARLCAINALGLLNQAAGGLDAIQILRVGGFVASAKGFTSQPKVINGASDLLVEVLGNRGKHARAAVGVAELPLGAAVEVEFTARLLR